MLRTIRAGFRLDDVVETSLRRLSSEIEARQFATIEAAMLKPLDGGPDRLGSKPLIQLTDERSRRYILKLAEPALRAAEIAAYELRRLGRRPAVPARNIAVVLPEVGEVEGLLKPFVEFDAAVELSTDTTTWTPLQRAILLQEHAWEWFLDNLDTNTSQYALIGPEGLPLNLDWDRAFSSDGRSELSRFAKYRRTLPNARNFLYDDFVQGKVELPFSLLVREARRIRALPANEVRRILEAFAEVRFEDLQAREEFVLRVLARRHRIEREVQRFVRSLASERRELRGPSAGLGASARHAAVLLWGRWQVVLNCVLRGPIGKACRGVLINVRGRRQLSAPKHDVESEAVTGR